MKYISYQTLASLAGTGFGTFKLPQPLHTMALAICMDLNTQPPALWRLEEGPYEVADFCVEKKANVLVLLNAWLDSGEEVDDPKDWSTMNFWMARLRPLWARAEDLAEEDEDDLNGKGEGEGGQTQQQGHETIVIVCNRCGQENGEWRTRFSPSLFE